MYNTELRGSLSEKSVRVTELEQEVEVFEGELSAAQQAAKQAPSRTMKALVERLRNQLSVKEKQQRVSCTGYIDQTRDRCRHIFNVAAQPMCLCTMSA